MKKVIGYARISTEDQSHFSIANQKEQIILFCERKGYQLLRIFTDEGQSAKNFDRKEWSKLNKYLAENKGNIDLLIVLKYDRFSRNIVEALTTIDELEQKYSVRLLSINEQIALPYDSPFFFQLRASMLLNAHHERLVISDRTKTGMRNAMKNGYFISNAPYGYSNAKDFDGKPTLKIIPEEAEVVRKMFEMYLNGYSFIEIKKYAYKKGYPHRGNSAVQKVLNNKTYAGYVKCSILNDPLEYAIGKHEAIISDDTFSKVQLLMKKPKPRVHENELAFMKQYVVCSECGRPMTCSRSKGRTKYYWYYECPEHRKSFGIVKAHDYFDAILKELTFSNRQIDLLQTNVQKQIQAHIKINHGKLPVFIAQKHKKTDMLHKVEEKYLSGIFDDDSFIVWKNKLKTELKKINEEIKLLQSSDRKYWEAVIEEFKYLRSLRDVFHIASLQEKRNFIEIGFGRTLSWDGNIYRTGFLNPIFAGKQLILSRKELLILDKNKGETVNFPLGSP